MLKSALFLLLIFCSLDSTFAEHPSRWAETTLETMSLEEKIGQIFLIAGYVDEDFCAKETGNPNLFVEIERYIQDYHVGGIAFVGPSSSQKQARLINHYQSLSKYSLLIAQDLEWGLSMRLEDGMSFPKNSALGFLEDTHLIHQMGKEIARQAKLVGVHMNFSPVLDVNRHLDNPVINVRSFGSCPQKVAKQGIAMIRGLQEGGIIASAKHFPGLGDIDQDPHLHLPLAAHSQERLGEVELYPFVQAIASGLLSIQTEHVLVPSLELDPSLPASLSPSIVTHLLKNQLSFDGLVISGALRMKGLTRDFSDEEIAVRAFLAGNDLLLMPRDFLKAYKAISAAIKSGLILKSTLDARVFKILKMKECFHIQEKRPLNIPGPSDLASPQAQQLQKKLWKSVIGFRKGMPPNLLYREEPIAYVQLGESASNAFFEELSSRLEMTPFDLLSPKTHDTLLTKLDKYSWIIFAVHPLDPRRITNIRLLEEKEQTKQLRNFHVHGIIPSYENWIQHLEKYAHKTIVTLFGSAYSLDFFKKYPTVLLAHEDTNLTQKYASEILQSSFESGTEEGVEIDW
ncbi:MAG: glycoside hydrolase family 3 N-terminal domain-containing protein [Chlamydiota bacterium]